MEEFQPRRWKLGPFEAMKVLVTGGSGFIGSHLNEYLLNQGHHVYIIDDLSTGSLENIAKVKAHPRFHYRIDSIMNVPLTADLVDQCDLIFHLAAAVGVRLIVDSPVHTIETNIKGTEIILELAIRKKKRVVITSTSEVYGKTTKVPFSEDDDLVLGPTHKGRWSYACSKAIDEFLALAYWREKQLPVVVARLFNTIGPRQTGQYGMVVPTFIKQALLGQPITVFGDGKQSRCFVHVSDVVDALYRLSQTPEALGQVFNIGSDEETTILGLAEKVRTVTQSPSEIKMIPYGQAYGKGFEDMARRIPDISKIDKTIGYRTTKNLDQIIEGVVEYYRHRLSDQRQPRQDKVRSFRASRRSHG